MESNLLQFSQRFLELSQEKTPMVVVTLTNVRGSAPQNIGAKMIIGENGILYGTVGGGKVEAHCIEVAQGYLAQQVFQPPQAFTWNLQKDIGMTCGGECSFLFETYKTESLWSIVIFGAGHISQELTKTLLNLNCQLKVIDNRMEWLEKLPTHPRLERVHNEKMEDEVTNLSENSFVALMTMGHAKDVPILYQALTQKDFPYLGVIGSKSKRNRMEKELTVLGLPEDKLSVFVCPIGEDLGTNSPAEIAISITAQLLRARDKK